MKIKRIGEHALPLPSRATAGSAGFDLRARLGVGEMCVLEPGKILLVRTGFAAQIPAGWCGLVCPRSGMALRGITVLNAPGVIDSDYRGEIGVILVNHGSISRGILHGDRIAQLVLVPGATAAALEEVAELDDTARGSGGFGSTDVS